MINITKIISDIENQNIVDRAVQHIKNKRLIIYPTDTSYGLGTLYGDNKNISNIYILKGRDESKKLSVVIPNIEWAINYLEVNKIQEDIIRQYLPGKYTFILKLKNSKDTLGIRIPKSKFINAIVQQINQPITATSANISGQNDCFNITELKSGILKRADILNINIECYYQGQLKIGERSTVVDLTKTPPVILRQGSGIFNY